MVWENPLRKLLEKGTPTLGTRVHSSWPTIVELVGYTGIYDYVEFAAEYAPFDLYALENLGRAFNLHGLSGMIKVGQECRSFQAVKALNSGFQGVNFADVRNAEDGRNCVRSVRAESPETGGLRGVEQGRDCGHVLEVGTTRWIETTRQTVIAFMIEKKEAVESIDAILALEGLDMITFGKADYSMDLGLAGQRDHPAVLEAQTHVIRRAHAHGIPARAEIDHPDQSELFLGLGVRHFSIGLDVRILHGWWEQHGKRMREIFASAGDQSSIASTAGD